MQSDLISRSSKLGSDPLSDVLSLVRTRGFMSGGLDMGGAWAYSFEADGAFRCFAVVSGQCWLSLADGSNPILVSEGEFFAMPHGKRFSLTSDPAIIPTDIYQEMDGPLNGRVLSLRGGGGCCLFGAIFTFRQDFANILLDVLPAVLHIGSGEDRAALRAYLDRMMALLRVPQPGSILVTEHLAETMLIEVLRLHVTRDTGKGVGWLFALSDVKLSRAVTAMHEQPWHRWTVQELSDRAGMSRSSFALRFKEKVGVAVMEYLIRWRMLLAADRLVASSDPVGSIAGQFGYESDSAFVFAFRREMGCTPRQYRHRSALAA
ncbi:AraC family transcriptional regulator [Sphingomonas sp. PAMC 26621]|uniref:AraC family transcriptional regulator n=1 Tax=Sphingomonas sp. PAMC 26621 TaxID=1112213 RepID=UPI00047529A4|nr:AraC family transcriptional regulator [Sphingomonas sp. PAMC 26621]